MGFIFNAVVYVSGYIFLLFVAVCLACGLYYLAELVEEHTTLTKRLMYVCTYAVLAAHPLFYLFEQLPLLAVLCGGATHACYLWLLKTFPYLHPLSPPFIASLVGLVGSHYFWLSHFLSHYHSTTHVLCFLLFAVWLVPFGFFISLSANESTLPDRLGGGGGGLGGLGGFGLQGGSSNKAV